MITGEDIINFIHKCKLEDKDLEQDGNAALMFISKNEYIPSINKHETEYIGINKQTGRYYKRRIVEEEFVYFE